MTLFLFQYYASVATEEVFKKQRSASLSAELSDVEFEECGEGVAVTVYATDAKT